MSIRVLVSFMWRIFIAPSRTCHRGATGNFREKSLNKRSVFLSEPWRVMLTTDRNEKIHAQGPNSSIGRKIRETGNESSDARSSERRIGGFRQCLRPEKRRT